MIASTTYLDDARWRVEINVLEDCDDATEAIDAIIRIGCRGADLAEAASELRRCGLNTGLTYSNADKRTSVIVIGLADSPAEFVNTLRHEQHHAIMHICSADRIDPYGEAAAYVAGEIGSAMYIALKTAGLL